MNEIYLILILFLLFFINEKIGILYILSFIINLNYQTLIKNLLFLLPIISLYLNKSNFINKLNSYKLKKQFNNDVKPNHRAVSGITKKIVASNQQWRCNICKSILDYTYEIDHNIPLFKGGTNELNNLQALCRNCHGKKTIIDNY